MVHRGYPSTIALLSKCHRSRVLSSWFLFPLIGEQHSVTGWKFLTLPAFVTVDCRLVWKWSRIVGRAVHFTFVAHSNHFSRSAWNVTSSKKSSLLLSSPSEAATPPPIHFTPSWVMAPPPLHLNYLCGSWFPSTVGLCPLPITHTPNVRMNWMIGGRT